MLHTPTDKSFKRKGGTAVETKGEVFQGRSRLGDKKMLSRFLFFLLLLSCVFEVDNRLVQSDDKKQIEKDFVSAFSGRYGFFWAHSVSNRDGLEIKTMNFKDHT